MIEALPPDMKGVDNALRLTAQVSDRAPRAAEGGPCHEDSHIPSGDRGFPVRCRGRNVWTPAPLEALEITGRRPGCSETGMPAGAGVFLSIRSAAWRDVARLYES